MSMQQVPMRQTEGIGTALTEWLRGLGPDTQKAVVRSIRQAEGGGSSETFFLNVHTGGTLAHWVLRIEAQDHRIYQEASVERQYHIMATLADNDTASVPRMLWYEADPAILGAPFYLMERVQGEALPTMHHSEGLWARASPSAREAMWLSAVGNMAAVHRADPADFAFLERSDAGATALDREIAHWDAYRVWAGIAPLPAYDRARRWLDDHRPAPTPAGLAWGDARPGNMIYANDRVQAVIDWETASLAGAETDLGWWLFYDWQVTDGIGVPRLSGVGDRTATLTAWADFAGRVPRDMPWHELFATWRFGLIVDRSLLLASRRSAVDPRAEAARHVVADRLDELMAQGY